MSIRWINGSTTIEVLGGYNEVGGNIIQVSYRGSRVFLDIGYSLKRYKDLYEWPKRRPKGIEEMIRVGLAPKVECLYTRWLNDGLEPDIEYCRDTDIQAIFISHPHLDHIALITQVNRNIPIYIGEASKHIIDIRNEISVRERYNRYDYIKFNTFRSFHEITLDYFRITPIHVDHSIPGSYGFIIETPDTIIGYTGDYRLHGQEESITIDYILKCREYKPDLLITEGTRVHDVIDIKEKDVYNWIKSLSTKIRHPILIDASYLDVDRIRSIIEASKDSDKRLIISGRHFYYLYNLIKRDRKLSLDLNKDYIEILDVGGGRKKIYREFIEGLSNAGYNIIQEKDFTLNEDSIYMDFTSYIQNLLDKVRPGTVAVFSNSEPFDEESYLDYRKIINWLNILNIPSYRIHSSGHANPLDIKKMIKDIRPNEVLVVHSEYPNVLKSFIGY